MAHVLIANKKCTGCHMCELACSAWHEGGFQPSLARLRVVVNPSAGRSRGFTCLQGACKKCLAACPRDALCECDGVVSVDEGVCDGCETLSEPQCARACPTKVIAVHPRTGKAFKCDMCDGEPQCVLACQNPEVAAISVKREKTAR